MNSAVHDYILSTSRGESRNGSKNVLRLDREILPHLVNPEQVVAYHQKGRKLDQLITVLEKTHRENGSPDNCHAYFLAGYVDLTIRDVEKNYTISNSATGFSWQGPYDEVIFMDNVEEAVAKATERYQWADKKLRRLGIRPCFATVPPSVLADWNEYRLSSGATSFLLHHHHYHDMQSLLNKSCQQINSIICTINKNNGMATPLIAGTIMDTRKNKQGQQLEPRVYRNKYYDGVHATDKTLREWSAKFVYAINTNRTRTDFPPLDAGLGPDFEELSDEEEMWERWDELCQDTLKQIGSKKNKEQERELRD